jgi:hypothetical protein
MTVLYDPNPSPNLVQGVLGVAENRDNDFVLDPEGRVALRLNGGGSGQGGGESTVRPVIEGLLGP